MQATRLNALRALMTIVASASVIAGCPNRLDERVSKVPPTAPAITDFGECGDPQTGDLLGHSLAFGFFNPGERADFVAGAPGRDTNRGVACVYRGRADGLVDVFAILDASSAGAGFRDAGDRFGWAVAAGDFNDDGFDDVVVGAPQDDTLGLINNGAIYFIPGLGSETFGDGVRISNPVGPDGAQGNARFGSALVSGDFNGDAIPDLAVGSPLRNIGSTGNAGKVYVYLGNAGFGVSASIGFDLDQTDIFAGFANEANDEFGTTLATGDLDGDGFDELVIGVPLEDVQRGKMTGVGGTATERANAGIVMVAHGCATPGLCAGAFFTQAPFGLIETNDQFGHSVAVADFDGDGFDDVAAGAHLEDDEGKNDLGVVIWRRGGLFEDGLVLESGGLLVETQGEDPGIPENNTLFGAGLAAGYFNDDGFADLAVGASNEDYLAYPEGGDPTDPAFDFPRAGLVSIWFGTASGVGRGNYYLAQEKPEGTNVGTPGENGDSFGERLLAADVSGDTLDDLIIVALHETNDGNTNAGGIFIARSDINRDCLAGGFTGVWDGTLTSRVPDVPPGSPIDETDPTVDTGMIEVHLCELPAPDGGLNDLRGEMLTLDAFDSSARLGGMCGTNPGAAATSLNVKTSLCGDFYAIRGSLVDASTARVEVYWNDGILLGSLDLSRTVDAITFDLVDAPDVDIVPDNPDVNIFVAVCISVRGDLDRRIPEEAPTLCDDAPPLMGVPLECADLLAEQLWWESGGPVSGGGPGGAGGSAGGPGSSGAGPGATPDEAPPEMCP
jgi:hypothetical protein